LCNVDADWVVKKDETYGCREETVKILIGTAKAGKGRAGARRPTPDRASMAARSGMELVGEKENTHKYRTQISKGGNDLLR